MKRPGAALAGIFSLALVSVVLLCGAGNVPVENFTPRGTMQADLDAGGHNLTNVATLSATNVTVSGTLSAANLGSAAMQNASAFQAPITLTTSGTSGAATFSTGTLNIPNYSSGSGTATYASTSGTSTFATTAGSTGSYTGSALLKVANNLSDVADPAVSTANLNKLNPNSIVICYGDSITLGYPVVSTGTGVYAVSYTGPGYCYPQWLSALPQFHNIAVYDFGISGESSGNFLGRANNSVTNYGTEYRNGAVVGSYGGINTSASALVSALGSGGAAYCVAMYGVNDATSLSATGTYTTNMGNGFSYLHGLGANVVCIACTPTGDYEGLAGANVLYQKNSYNQALYVMLSTGTTTSPDAVVPTYAALGTPASAGGSIWNGDLKHFLSPGYKLIANMVAKAILDPNPYDTYLASPPLPILQGSYSGNPIILYGDGSQSSTIGWSNSGGSFQYATINGFAAKFGYNTAGSNAFTEVWRYTNNNLLVGTTSDVSGSGSVVASTAFWAQTAFSQVNGSATGSVTFAEPFRGSGYKKVVINLGSTFAGTATLTLPTAFSNTPVVVNNDAAVTTTGTGTLVVTGTLTLPRTVIVEGD